MATLVRLTEEQITHLLEAADRMERDFKTVHEELVAANIPDHTLDRFSRLHDGFTSAMSYIRHQRDLAG
jgi:hypothetical protein